ncbi:hypothetical protein ABTE52_19840, partial [Acinetobacter baumannii]
MKRWIASSQALLAMTIAASVLLSPGRAFAADAGFTNFVASLWPDAQKAGISRATFDAQTRGL